MSTYTEGWKAAIDVAAATIEDMNSPLLLEQRSWRKAAVAVRALRVTPHGIDTDPPATSEAEHWAVIEQRLASCVATVEQMEARVEQLEIAKQAGEKLLADRIAKTQAEIELMEKDLDVKLAIARQKISESLDKSEQHQARIMRDIAPRYRKRKNDHE